MLDRAVAGQVPPKPHLRARDSAGNQLYEECLTRAGFEGAFSMLYHRNRPHEGLPVAPNATFRAPHSVGANQLVRRHYRCLELAEARGVARVPLLFNAEVTIGFVRPTSSDSDYFVNADGDELFFVLHGGGTLRSVFGELGFGAGDYVCVPKGVLHRFMPAAGEAQAWLWIETRGGLGLPRHYRNPVGQLRMDAPYSHRDFRRPELGEPLDEGIRTTLVKRGDELFAFRSRHSPLDVIGWDGSVYPFVLPILAFQPRVGQVHLPPPAHATFEAPGVLICSFVPRPLDFHPEANPCPYPHSSVDMDEVLFYANGAFGSRRGIGVGSLSHHPAGIAHGPHPRAYEESPIERHTEEIAVMLDCGSPLKPTADALAVEDATYHESFQSA
jgi:homogentisate 1,2-dioxygenase